MGDPASGSLTCFGEFSLRALSSLPADPRDALAAAWDGTRRIIDPSSTDLPPFLGGWIGSISYEFGRRIEPAAAGHHRSLDRHDWPELLWWRCPAAYVHDGLSGRWWRVGDPAASLPDLSRIAACEPGEATFDLAPPSNSKAAAQRDYTAIVARAVEYIREGDVFQVNLAHRLRGEFSGSTRSLFAEAVRRSQPWYGAYLESPPEPGRRAATLSLSPELFVEFDPSTRRVTTRPIKGTRPGAAPDHELASSPKDAAELAMIVDLMRNDLGRVCAYGTVRVLEPRTFERHARGTGMGSGGVLHGVATIEGQVRQGLGLRELLRATFPAGSITGAPKVRAMQIINELEAAPRGPYTGTIGYVSDCGRACFNVAIRTALVAGTQAGPAPGDGIRRGEWTYHAGAGIVADSDPVSEWQETLTKAGVIGDLAKTLTIRPRARNSAERTANSAHA